MHLSDDQIARHLPLWYVQFNWKDSKNSLCPKFLLMLLLSLPLSLTRDLSFMGVYEAHMGKASPNVLMDPGRSDVRD